MAITDPNVNGSQVLYETRHHASRSYSSSNYPPLHHHQQVNESSLFSFISTKGLSEFRERWTKNRHPHKLSKWISMFVSPSGEHVAIAVGKIEINILQRDDNYQEPCGIFTRPYSISLWQWCRESGLQQVASAEFEGLYAKTKGYLDQVSSPKVLFSPEGKFVATLDLRGCLVIYKLSEERLLTVAYLKDKNDLSNIIDFTWWTDRILVIASRSGKIAMIDIDSGVKVLENDFQYSLPILERVPQLSGCIFILESRSSESNIAPSDLILFEPVTLEKHKQFESAKLQWSLLSFSKKSVQELYDILISSQQFDAAFKLADHHVLDKDDVLKAQWLHSLHGTKVEDEEGSATWDFRLARLKLLQFRDRLETFIGINMGRFSAQDYRKFRSLPIKEAATALAESGKIGALNLLFKRHPYSVSALREVDWVERESMVNYIKTLPEIHESGVQIRTEPIVKQLTGYIWPSTDELSNWYKCRARDMDTLSGQLDNCLSLIEFACRKGIKELQDIESLITWEQLSDYEKFKLMLKGINEENVIKRLQDRALPFMHKKLVSVPLPPGDEVVDTAHSFLVRWMKEVAMENKIEVCLIVIEEGCKEFGGSSYFRNEAEAVDCALQCLYLVTATDKWSTMASILSKLPYLHEGHVEAGRLLTLYQVPKPITFFLEAQSDSKSVKQILRLILSKFIRRQPGRTDNDWANMWRDFQSLQEKAFPFVDLEYMLMEFCRGLLKAGKFSLARNYLKGSGSVVLPTEKAENIIISEPPRELLFYQLHIWKAKECLNILPSSRNVMIESDIIDALTVKLPRLGVNILPMQFKQIKDPMEIIKLAITSQVGAYLNVDELIEIAKLLGLNSQDEISSVQEAIAREAAVAGDLQLAFDLCLIMAKKGHGPVWDLCTALARGPALENMDINSRKQLLGFALSHCDKDSIGELLHAWKDLDMISQCEKLSTLTGEDVPDLSGHDIVDLIDSSGQRRELLLGKFQEEIHITKFSSALYTPLGIMSSIVQPQVHLSILNSTTSILLARAFIIGQHSDPYNIEAQSSFWREWKLKLDEQKHTRAIEQIIHGIETTRFLSGDITYMKSVVFSFIEFVKIEKKRILNDVMKLASDYGLDQTKVLLKFLSSTLLSEIWTNDDIKSEISQFEYKILDCAEDIFKTISLSVYPEIDGRNKERLAYIYNLLSSCFSRVEEKKRLLNAISADQSNLSIVELDSFYKIMEQECSKLSFMENLNFKNIAGLHGPNLACVTNEIYANVNEKSVEALAEMVKTLAGIFKDGVPEGLVPWPYVYGYYISNSLTALENSAKSEVHFQTPENLQLFINELELTLIDDLQKFISSDDLEGKFSPTCVLICLEAFIELVNEETILTSEGWASIFAYINFGLVGDSYIKILNFCRSMIFFDCRFKAIGYVYHAAISHFFPHANLSSEVQRHYDNIVDLPHLYIRILNIGNYIKGWIRIL
ncbi:MAG2-interacting protein 2 [Tanacetum coccineum]